MKISAGSPSQWVCTIGRATVSISFAQRCAVRQLPLLAARVPGVTMRTTGRRDFRSPMLTDVDALADALRESREYTFSLVDHLADSQWKVPRWEIVNPLGWEVGHIGFFQEFFCVRWRPDDRLGERTASCLDGADALYDCIEGHARFLSNELKGVCLEATNEVFADGKDLRVDGI